MSLEFSLSGVTSEHVLECIQEWNTMISEQLNQFLTVEMTKQFDVQQFEIIGLHFGNTTPVVDILEFTDYQEESLHPHQQYPQQIKNKYPIAPASVAVMEFVNDENASIASSYASQFSSIYSHQRQLLSKKLQQLNKQKQIPKTRSKYASVLKNVSTKSNYSTSFHVLDYLQSQQQQQQQLASLESLKKPIDNKPSRITTNQNTKGMDLQQAKPLDALDFLLEDKGCKLKLFICYDGNASIEIQIEIVLHVPTPQFIVVPITLKLSHVHLEGNMTLLYHNHTIKCYFDTCPLKDFQLQVEMNDDFVDKGLISNFVMEKLREIITSQIVFPNSFCKNLEEMINLKQ